MPTPQWALEIIERAKDQGSSNLDLDRPAKGKQLTEIPKEVFELSHLETLNLSYNHISSLPKAIADLSKLTSLNLSYNHFTNLAANITQLSRLSIVNLTGNLLTNLPEDLAQLNNLTSIDLSYNQITSFPESLINLESLIELDLSNNSFDSLPRAIAKLHNLRKLNLVSLGLRNLPETILGLQNLTTLDLRSNWLSVLPEGIGNLQNLTYLNVSNNRLNSLPKSIHKLTNLITLDLSNNRLSTLPESITNLQNLVTLHLSRNRIPSLPDDIANLQNLKTLKLEDNYLTNLPEAIAQLVNLGQLDVFGNKLITPPPEVANRGISAIRDYFRQINQAGQDKLYESKLLILGEGGAGKTTLAKKIENPEYELQNEESSTEGVDVIQWSFGLDRDRSFRVNIWDFGGQEIYHATHQFFLTKRSLYILVSDTRKEDTDFYYWLNVIELLSDNSPLLIVKNEIQERRKEINERQLKGEFNNLREVLSTNFATNRGLDEIIRQIKHYVQGLPHVGSPLPKTWVRVREALEKDVRHYVRLDEYLEICVRHGFSEKKDAMQLSGYLHDLGVILHFQDDPLLRKTVILKPTWGTEAVYKILDNKEIISNLGQFTYHEIEKIWNKPENEGMRDELLQLMMKFKLCYEIPNQKGVYIAPQLLTENQAEYEWDEEGNLLLRYNYEFMPKGILSQFIVSMHQYIWEQRVVWKSGVVLERDRTRAEVIEYYGKREIRIRVAGIHKKELLTIVMFRLDEIHKSYSRLKYDKLIPCNCEECSTTKEPHFYRYDILHKFMEDRQVEIQCQQSYEMINVRNLLDDMIDRRSEIEMENPLIRRRQITHSNFSVGDNFSGTINYISGSKVENSLGAIDSADISDELKDSLKNLTLAVEIMKKQLSNDQATQVTNDLKELVEQATNKAPDKKWYSVSVTSLTKAAENVGKVGEPVVKLAGQVLGLLLAS